MNAIDFSPLFRTAIGFDRLARLMDNARQRRCRGVPALQYRKDQR